MTDEAGKGYRRLGSQLSIKARDEPLAGRNLREDRMNGQIYMEGRYFSRERRAISREPPP